MDNTLFEHAPVPRAYFSLALPVVCSMLVTLVYNAVDTYFIAHTGNTDMVAGVSLAAPVFTAMIALGDLFGLGGSSVISRLFGQRRHADAKRLSVFTFYAAILTGLLVIVLGFAFEEPILTMLGADPSTMPHASAYYRWIIAAAPFIILSMGPGNTLRAAGLPLPSMLGTVIGTVVNIVLNPLFIQVFGWGAAGSAAATFVANVVGDIYFIWVLVRRCDSLSIDPRLLWRRDGEDQSAGADVAKTIPADAATAQTAVSAKRRRARFAVPANLIGQVVAIGVPASLTNITQSIGVILVNLFLLPYGNDAVAAMGIALKIVMIAVLILVGFAFGAQPLIGYAYGGGHMRRLASILRFAYGFQCALALVMTATLWLGARLLMGFFIDDPTIIDLGTGMLRVQLLSTVCVAVVLVTTATFQSAGKAVGALILAVSRQGVMLLATLVIGERVAGYHGVIAAQAFADLATAVLAVALFAVMLRPLLGIWKRPA
ncbi:MATE family efflux transporter [Bifidobacterium lemurum]|uniref:MATE family efflux transporter n=1 Tax=Bifidobacterium lemurum TaxID=1603886 RepID=A0A261FS00_9BIFI|nr:MATE family efflux transporter [Bifidobacterium lemurum]OZG61919.1 MATE family efflux transporter [Bifidobacterium lemurum]QOL35298.1 polysaccharide biosynthesis C-terminal domain-containing protein [Bifidobacterium lemurum]